MIELNLYNTLDGTQNMVSINPRKISVMFEVDAYSHDTKSRLFNAKDHGCSCGIVMPTFCNNHITIMTVDGMSFVYDGSLYQLKEEIKNEVDNAAKNEMFGLLGKLNL